MAVRHKPNLFQSGKWPSISSRPLGLLLILTFTLFWPCTASTFLIIPIRPLSLTSSMFWAMSSFLLCHSILADSPSAASVGLGIVSFSVKVDTETVTWKQTFKLADGRLAGCNWERCALPAFLLPMLHRFDQRGVSSSSVFAGTHEPTNQCPSGSRISGCIWKSR